MLCDIPGTAEVVYTCNVVWWSEKVAWETHYIHFEKSNATILVIKNAC